MRRPLPETAPRAAAFGAEDDARGVLRLRFFDLHDLPDSVAVPSTTPASPGTSASLVDAIRAVVDPESWTLPGRSIEARNRVLVVKNRVATLDRVGEFIARTRREMAEAAGDHGAAPATDRGGR